MFTFKCRKPCHGTPREEGDAKYEWETFSAKWFKTRIFDHEASFELYQPSGDDIVAQLWVSSEARASNVYDQIIVENEAGKTVEHIRSWDSRFKKALEERAASAA